MHSKHRLGRANTESIYYQSWQRIKPMADTTISASFLTHAAITHAARKTALNWRFGTLWSNKMAFRCQQSNTMQCPLCGLTDGGEHISGGCRHASMERMYTERHNSTGKIILRAIISKGNMGAELVMADLAGLSREMRERWGTGIATASCSSKHVATPSACCTTVSAVRRSSSSSAAGN